MAGLGFKDFQVGEVLTSSDVDGYLMQQSVMRFADSSARGSALGTAAGTGVALAEGMISYLQDTNAVEVYDGSVWKGVSLGIGTNAVTDVETATFSESLSGSGESAAVLTAAITPSSATSKVFVQVNVSASLGLANFYNTAVFLVKRDGTAVGVADAAGNRTQVTTGNIGSSNDVNSVASASSSFIDSPASTSSLTYTVHLFNPTSSTATAYLNRTVGDSDATQRPRMISTLTLIEVAA